MLCLNALLSDLFYDLSIFIRTDFSYEMKVVKTLLGDNFVNVFPTKILDDSVCFYGHFWLTFNDAKIEGIATHVENKRISSRLAQI